ncbi:lipopolysaccharide biosynthesis protein [Rhodococcus gannanensis]|uniref:Lipopolysaccharide biosynthesis protein n=1 Tax=Rhodococcus gannanensis TaxID=1960308 RepID=A0ABW4NYX4_9NOCA
MTTGAAPAPADGAAGGSGSLGTDEASGVAGDGPGPTPDSGVTAKSLERNSLALTVSAALTGILGLGYWALLGRHYPAREVGAASAVITTATMLSAFGNISLGALFERFLPLAGIRGSSLVRTGFLVGGCGGLLLGALFLLWGPTDEMFDSPLEAASFPLIVLVFSAFALLDHTSVGLREAGWAATKNVTHAVVKLVAALALAFTASRLAIIWTWTVPALIAALVLGAAVARRLRRPDLAHAASQLPGNREMGSFLAGSYGIYVVGSLAPLMLPLIVVAKMGADHNAYFSIAWSLVSAVLVLMTVLMGPYVAGVAADPGQVRELTRRFLVVLAVVTVAGVVLFAGIAPVLLQIVGDEYADTGTPLLRLAAIALIPAIVGFAYNAVARVRRRLRLAIAVQVANAALVLGLSLAFIGDHGLVAIGWAYVVAETVSAVVLIVPLVRAVRALGREPLDAQPASVI